MWRLPWPLRVMFATIFVVCGYIPMTIGHRISPIQSLKGAVLAWRMVWSSPRNWWIRK